MTLLHTTLQDDQEYSRACGQEMIDLMCRDDTTTRQNCVVDHEHTVTTKTSSDTYAGCRRCIMTTYFDEVRCVPSSLQADMRQAFPSVVGDRLHTNLNTLNDMRLRCIDSITRINEFVNVKNKRTYYRLLSCCDLGIRSHLAAVCGLNTHDTAFGVMGFGVAQILNYHNDSVHLSKDTYDCVQAGMLEVHTIFIDAILSKAGFCAGQGYGD